MWKKSYSALKEPCRTLYRKSSIQPVFFSCGNKLNGVRAFLFVYSVYCKGVQTRLFEVKPETVTLAMLNLRLDLSTGAGTHIAKTVCRNTKSRKLFFGAALLMNASSRKPILSVNLELLTTES